MGTYPDGETWIQLCIVGEGVLGQVVAQEKTTHWKNKTNNIPVPGTVQSLVT